MFRLFEYGTLMTGEVDHATLRGATPIATLRTARGYQLVETRALAGLVESGDADVVGELYELPRETMAACDLLRGHPTLFLRKEIRLADGSTAFAYVLRDDQARGLRRIRGGDWRQRFASPKAQAGALVSWARARHRR